MNVHNTFNLLQPIKINPAILFPVFHPRPISCDNFQPVFAFVQHNQGRAQDFYKRGEKFLDPPIQGGEIGYERGETLKEILFKHNFRGGETKVQWGESGKIYVKGGKIQGGISPPSRNQKVIFPLFPPLCTPMDLSIVKTLAAKF